MLWLRRSPGMRWQAWLLGLRKFVVETLTWDALAGLVVRFEKYCG